jgi:superfamily II DNA or RNA helicase
VSSLGERASVVGGELFEGAGGAAQERRDVLGDPFGVALASEPGYKTLVIFDEIHRVGTDRDWGTAAQQAFGAQATRILSLSGTPFRTRGRGSIAFVETRDGETIADYAYSYGDALADGVCRPLRFAAIGGTATFQTRRGGTETVSFDDDLNDRGESYRLLTMLAPNGDHLSRVCIPVHPAWLPR